MRRLFIPLLLCLALPHAAGQRPDHTAGVGEFPGLQLLPAGSIVKGISLPRYEKHRVSALIMADVLEVLTRYEVRMEGINTALYDESGETTTVRIKEANYDFRTSLMVSQSPASVQNPRFSADGEAVSFNSETQQGLLKGPVRTTLNTAALSTAPNPLSSKK